MNAYENISASCCLGVSRCEIWQLLYTSSMLDNIKSIYTLHDKKSVWMRISVNSKDLTNSIVVWFFYWFVWYVWTWESNYRGEVSFLHQQHHNISYSWTNGSPARSFEPKIDKITSENKYTLYLLEQLVHLFKNTYCISQITKPHQALGTLWVLKDREEIKC